MTHSENVAAVKERRQRIENLTVGLAASLLSRQQNNLAGYYAPSSNINIEQAVKTSMSIANFIVDEVDKANPLPERQ